MDSVGTQSGCVRCVELQRSLLKTLEEKRTLLLRVQREQERSRTLQRELGCLKAKKSDNCNNQNERKSVVIEVNEVKLLEFFLATKGKTIDFIYNRTLQ